MRDDAAGSQGVEIRGLGVAEPGRVRHGPARVDLGLDTANRNAREPVGELQRFIFQ